MFPDLTHNNMPELHKPNKHWDVSHQPKVRHSEWLSPNVMAVLSPDMIMHSIICSYKTTTTQAFLTSFFLADVTRRLCSGTCRSRSAAPLTQTEAGACTHLSASLQELRVHFIVVFDQRRITQIAELILWPISPLSPSFSLFTDVCSLFRRSSCSHAAPRPFSAHVFKQRGGKTRGCFCVLFV